MQNKFDDASFGLSFNDLAPETGQNRFIIYTQNLSPIMTAINGITFIA